MISSFLLIAQNPEWRTYANGDYIYSIAIENNKIWVGTNGGLYCFDKQTGTSTFYNSSTLNQQ